MNHYFMVRVLLLLQLYQSRIQSWFVDANLLKQLPKPTPEPPTPTVLTSFLFNNNRFIYEFSSYSSSSPLQNQKDGDYYYDKDISALLYQNFSKNIETQVLLYANFLKDYSKWNNWNSIALYFPFPKVNTYICKYFQRFLLRSNELHVLCKTYDPGIINNNNNNRTTVTSITGGTRQLTQRTDSTTGISRFDWTSIQNDDELNNTPIVTLNFLRKSGNIINPKLTQQLPLRSSLLMLGKNLTLAIEESQLHPNSSERYNFNYKITLASLEGSQGLHEENITSLLESKIHLDDIYGFATTSEPIRKKLGFWTKGNGLNVGSRESINSLENFQGIQLRVTSVEGNPVVYLDRDPNTKKIIKDRGYVPDIMETISQHLNFTYILIEPTDRSFGSPDAFGNWSGMVGQMQRQEVDIAMMSFSLTAARKHVMDFAPPIEYSAARLLIRRDFENTELKWKVFLSPFEWKVWIAIPCTIGLGVLVLQCFSYFNVMNVTPISSICLLFICILQKSLEGHSLFTNLPSRIALGSIWILAVVIYASYTAVLTSFLASNTERLPLNSLSEAIASKNWKVGLVKGSSYQDRVKNSPLPEMKQFYKRIEQDDSGLVSGFAEGFEKVFNEKYAFFTSDLVPTFMIKDNCSYAWVPGTYFPGFGYMGYQKNLPFATPISHRVAKIRETGQMKRLFKKWWGETSTCSGVGDDFVGMSLYETGTAFIILIIGMSLAITFFAGEIFYLSKRKHSTNLSSLSQESIIPHHELIHDIANLDNLSLRKTSQNSINIKAPDHPFIYSI